MGAELGHHLGYPVGASADAASNQRNGESAKTVLTEGGPPRMEVSRDRDSSFGLPLIARHERRFTGFDDKIIAMYARGMTMREIQGFLREFYATEVSAEFISSVTEAVVDEVTAWQSRALEAMYPVVFFVGLGVKFKEDTRVGNNVIYLVRGALLDGTEPHETKGGYRCLRRPLCSICGCTTAAVAEPMRWTQPMSLARGHSR